MEPLETLLQLMLRWDPVQRGGGLSPESRQPQCFSMLEQILNMKVGRMEHSVLFCSALFCALLCSALLCSVLCCVLFCSVLLCCVLRCSVLFCSALFCLEERVFFPFPLFPYEFHY